MHCPPEESWSSPAARHRRAGKLKLPTTDLAFPEQFSIGCFSRSSRRKAAAPDLGWRSSSASLQPTAGEPPPRIVRKVAPRSPWLFRTRRKPWRKPHEPFPSSCSGQTAKRAISECRQAGHGAIAAGDLRPCDGRG